MAVPVQLVSFINIICQNMQQSNITSYTGLLPSVCEGKTKLVELTYGQRICVASVKTCPGYKADQLNPVSFWKQDPSYNFDVHSANGLNVTEDGFAVQFPHRGKKSVKAYLGILTNKGFTGLTPKYWAFETEVTFSDPVNRYAGMILFSVAFGSKKSFYKKDAMLCRSTDGYVIDVSLENGNIIQSALHHGSYLRRHYPKTIAEALKTKEIKLTFGILMDLAGKKILIINVVKGAVVTEFLNVNTNQPLWTLFCLNGMDWTRIVPKHLLMKQLKTSLAKLQNTWNITHLELQGS